MFVFINYKTNPIERTNFYKLFTVLSKEKGMGNKPFNGA
jgi:hypothetical protein